MVGIKITANASELQNDSGKKLDTVYGDPDHYLLTMRLATSVPFKEVSI